MARTLNGLAVAGLCAVMLGAFWFQFALGELPCPLCTLQRVAFALALVGFVLNVRFGGSGGHYALVLVSAAVGMVISGRQVLLHIAPNTGVYGSAVLGLHLYTWAFLVFAAMVPGTALLLALERPGLVPRAPGWAIAVCWLSVGLVGLNAVSIFLQCGPIECADDPVHWWVRTLGR